MQLYIALLALTTGIVTAQGPNYPPRNPFNPFRPRIPINFPDTSCPDSHPNGYGPGIGPTDCGQLTRDCGYFGVGQTCTTDYSYIVNCYGGQRTGYAQQCPFGTRCNAAVDGSGAFCASN